MTNFFSRDLNPDDEQEALQPRFLTGCPSIVEANFGKRVCNFLEQHGLDPFILFVAFFERIHPTVAAQQRASIEESDLDLTRGHTFGERTASLRHGRSLTIRDSAGWRSSYNQTQLSRAVTEIDRRDRRQFSARGP
jgi:hypothetical protein